MVQSSSSEFFLTPCARKETSLVSFELGAYFKSALQLGYLEYHVEISLLFTLRGEDFGRYTIPFPFAA
jgi:hypothetical protein